MIATIQSILRTPQLVHYADVQVALEAEQALIKRFTDPSVHYQVSWWTTEQCLVAPRSLRRAHNIDFAILESEKAGWPVRFRQTGGDVTPQGRGILNVAIAFALDPVEKPSISGVYQVFCAPIIQWLSHQGCDASTGFVDHCFCDGEYNIVVDGLKLAGTAQRWTRVRGQTPRQIVFAHALLLVDANLDDGIEAINRLYHNCSIERQVQADVHTNLTQVLGLSSEQIQQNLTSQVSQLYQDELASLTQ